MTTLNNARLHLVWYGATVFLSSAILLVLEITAGRLLAPYVGVTIYSWTSIIGVILAGLSLGNWLGGRWADSGASDLVTGIVLALAGMFSVGSLLVLTMIAPVLQQTSLDLISSSFLYVLGDYPGIGKNRHEVAVSGPPGDNVHVNMIDNTGPTGLPHVPADVETLGGTDFA